MVSFRKECFFLYFSFIQLSLHIILKIGILIVFTMVHSCQRDNYDEVIKAFL